jgi:hypothetical protein
VTSAPQRPVSLPTVTFDGQVIGQVHAENSDVSLVNRFVAVAVNTNPVGVGTVAEKLPSPLAFVKTLVSVRKVLPSPYPLPSQVLFENSST